MTYTKSYEADERDRSFPARLKTLLNKSHTTQVMLASYCNVSSAAVTGWMNGSEPSFQTLRRIAKKFGVTTDYLLGMNDNQNPSADYQAIGKAIGLSDVAIYNLHCLKNNLPVGGKALLGPALTSLVVSYKTSPVFSTNLLLENRDFLLLFYEYLGVEGKEKKGPLKDMEANSILLQIQKELMVMREKNHSAMLESTKANIGKAFTAREEDNG